MIAEHPPRECDEHARCRGARSGRGTNRRTYNYIKMSMIGVKGLNSTEGSNRIRFENISSRLQNLNVDVVHRVRESGLLDINKSSLPETGQEGCFFQDELERCKELELSRNFKRYYLVLFHFFCLNLLFFLI